MSLYDLSTRYLSTRRDTDHDVSSGEHDQIPLGVSSYWRDIRSPTWLPKLASFHFIGSVGFQIAVDEREETRRGTVENEMHPWTGLGLAGDFLRGSRLSE